MKMICAGMPKTGTKSIAKALHIGFTVFHWEEQIFEFLDHWSLFGSTFSKLAFTRMRIRSGYPAIVLYEEILEAFPVCR